MALAHLLLDSKLPFALAHVNYQLRGADADADEQLVKDWAQQQGITCHTTRFDTQAKMAEWKKGVQETARILRYEWLDNLRQQHGYAAIATAHHANDNVETLLMHLFKGTGISGLHGIPERNGAIIRPLLFATRAQIRDYVTERNVPFREDASNQKDAYLRNATRNNIIPAIEQHYPDAVQQISDGIRRFAQAEELYYKAIASEIKKLTEQRGKDIYIPVLKLQQRQPLETICYELFKPYGFTPAQTPQLLALLQAETGHYISSSTHRAIRNRNFIIITTVPHAGTDFITVEGFPCAVQADSVSFHFSTMAPPKSIPTDADTAYIDMRRITLPLILRKWKTGDYFYPLGMGMKKKKLSRYLIDRKVPLHEKEQLWVLECDKRIVWVAGMHVDERFKILPATEQVLKVTMKK